MRRTSEKVEKKVVRMYKDGMSSPAIGKVVGLSANAVIRICHRNSVTIRKAKTYNKYIKDNVRKRILNLYKRGHSTYELAKLFGFHQTSIYNMIRNTGVTMRNIFEARSKVSNKGRIELCKDYVNGMSTVDLDKKYSLGKGTSMGILIRADIKRRTLREATSLSHKQGKYRIPHEMGKHSSALENNFLAFVERKAKIKFERNQFGKRTFFADGYYFDAKLGDKLFEIDGRAHRFNEDFEYANYHKRLQVADDIDCKVIRITLCQEAKNRFNRAYQSIAPYLQ